MGTVKEAVEGLAFSWCLSVLAFLLLLLMCTVASFSTSWANLTSG